MQEYPRLYEDRNISLLYLAIHRITCGPSARLPLTPVDNPHVGNS